MMNKIYTLFCIAMLSLCCIACGENWSAGGATISGTGDPNNTQPGNGNGATDGEDFSVQPDLKMSAPVRDECQGIQRELTFIDPTQGTSIDVETTQKLTDGSSSKTMSNMVVRLTVTNLTRQELIEEQPTCYVPISMYNRLQKERFFPEQYCESTYRVTYAPNESKEFYIHHYLSKQAMDGEWRYGEESSYANQNGTFSPCDILSLQFSVIE